MNVPLFRKEGKKIEFVRLFLNTIRQDCKNVVTLNLSEGPCDEITFPELLSPNMAKRFLYMARSSCQRWHKEQNGRFRWQRQTLDVFFKT